MEMTTSAWAPAPQQQEPEGPEPGTWLRVPVVPDIEPEAMQALYDKLRSVAREAIEAGLAEAIGAALPTPTPLATAGPPPAGEVPLREPCSCGG